MVQCIKKKLCWNCEGRVELNRENCPFCGVYLSPSSDYEKQADVPFAPPYQIVEDDQAAPEAPPYEHVETQEHAALEKSSTLSLSSFLPPFAMRQVLFSLCTLLAGSMFFLFALVLFLFSKDGKLTLQWDADFWFYYFGISLVMLFFGWKALANLDAE